MITYTSIWVDGVGTVVGARLADVAIGDGRDFGAVLIAIGGFLSGTAAQLSGCLAVREGKEEDCAEYCMLHIG